MGTGACGIDCGVCRLNVIGICSSCGPGCGDQARRKREAQEFLLGAPCPILACAAVNRVDHCLRDCPQFPCDNFRTGPYPFSAGYLGMQERRRRQRPVSCPPYGSRVEVPPEHWDDIRGRDPETLCRDAGCRFVPPSLVEIAFLHEVFRVDLEAGRLLARSDRDWEPAEDPFLELLLLIYLIGAKPGGLTGERIGVRDFKSAHFFQGPHELRTGPVLNRFGRDPDGFCRAARAIGGMDLDMADRAFRFSALPKVPVDYLLWVSDDDFPPALSILFDRSVERHLAADAVWGLVNLISDALLRHS